MCTALEFTGLHHYFGRTLDLEYHYNEEVVITPRGFTFKMHHTDELKTTYAMIGIATVMDDYPLYYEAANEQGLCLAGLYFKDNAHYFEPRSNALNLAAFELIPYILGTCATVAEARALLERLNIVSDSFIEGLPVTALHWMLCDATECIVFEQTADGLHVYQNPYGVMTNNPTFPYHVQHVQQFQTLTPAYRLPCEPKDGVSFDCVGYGSLGLPGDYSSMSRFAKTVFLKETITKGANAAADLAQFFHVMDAVSMIEGSVLTAEGAHDTTVYTSCIDATEHILYYRTYTNQRLEAVRMDEASMNASGLARYALSTDQDILWRN